MGDWLSFVDVLLFRIMNDAWANPVGDVVFPFLTEVKNFYIPYALVLLAVMWFAKGKGVRAVVVALLAVTLSDQLNSFVLKPMFDRLRPCAVLEHVRLLVDCGGGKSFPSSHAVNNFTAAIVFSRFFPKATPYLLAFAALVAFSRVYVGVHYPSDILAGSFLGLALGYGTVFLAGHTERLIRQGLKTA